MRNGEVDKKVLGYIKAFLTIEMLIAHQIQKMSHQKQILK